MSDENKRPLGHFGLWKFFNENHGLLLTESEMDDIIRAVHDLNEGDTKIALGLKEPHPEPVESRGQNELNVIRDLQAFVGVMFGVGPDCIIPETARTPLGVDIKLGGIMRDVERILSNAATDSSSASGSKRAAISVSDVEMQLALRAADKMAWVCDDWVQRGVISSRSALADARLNYGHPYRYSWSKLEAPSVSNGGGSDASGSPKSEVPPAAAEELLKAEQKLEE